MSPITSEPPRPGSRISPPEELQPFLRRMAALAGGIALLVLAGAAGFVAADGVSYWQGFIQAIDTVATVGSIPEPASTAGQVVKVLLIVLGVGTLFYALVTVTEFFVAGQLSGLLAGRRMQRMISASDEHHIVCGYGRVGRQVARDLRAAGATFVVIDAQPENQERAEREGVAFILGDPSQDDVLRQAGVDRARSLVACVDSDADNVFITLTARGLRPDMAIVARAALEDTEAKLLRAGADRVISPYKASGHEMARLALTPQVTGVVDVAPEYRLEELVVSPGCAGAGRRLGEVRGAAVVVGLRRADGAFLVQPSADERLDAGDVLVAIGTPATLRRLEASFATAGDRAATPGMVE